MSARFRTALRDGAEAALLLAAFLVVGLLWPARAMAEEE
jgi:hypothetical protein